MSSSVAVGVLARTLTDIVARMKAFRPRCLFGYPSTISLFCSMTEDQGIELGGLGVRVVFSTAAVLYDHQKDTISRVLGGGLR